MAPGARVAPRTPPLAAPRLTLAPEPQPPQARAPPLHSRARAAGGGAQQRPLLNLHSGTGVAAAVLFCSSRSRASKRKVLALAADRRNGRRGSWAWQGAREGVPQGVSELFDVMHECGRMDKDGLWAARMQAAVRSGTWEDALRVLVEAEKERIKPGTGMLKTTLVNLIRGRQFDAALDVAAQMRAQGFDLDTEGYSYLITAAALTGQAEVTLAEMKSKGMQPTAQNYVTVVREMLRKDRLFEALELLRESTESGLRPSSKIFDVLLQYCHMNDAWQTSVAILDGMLHKHDIVPSSSNFGRAIAACQHCGQTDKCRELFLLSEALGVQTDEREFNVLLAASANAGDADESLEYLKMMDERDIPVSAKNLSCAMAACSFMRRWEDALALLGQFETRKLAKTDITYNTAISACGRAGQELRAMAIFEEMQLNDDVEPDSYTYGSAMYACAQGKQWMRALGLLAKMERVGVKRNAVSFNTGMLACSRAGQWEEVLSTMQNMCELNVTPTEPTFATAIAAMDAAKQWPRALALLEDMKRFELVPDELMKRQANRALEVEQNWAVSVQMEADLFDMKIEKQQQLKDLAAEQAVEEAMMSIMGVKAEPAAGGLTSENVAEELFEDL